MDLFNRFLGSLVGLKLAVAGLAVLAFAGRLASPDLLSSIPELQSAVLRLLDQPVETVNLTALGGGLAGLLGLLLMWAETRGGRRSASGPTLVIQQDTLGVVSVSLAGVHRLGEHVLAQVPGITGAALKVRQRKDGVAMTVRSQVQPDVSAMDVSEQVRSRLGEAVRNHLGKPLVALDIEVEVVDRAPAPRSRRSPA